MNTTSLSKISKAIIILFLLFSITKTISAQSGKAHYVINNPDNVVQTSIYETAFKDFDFASYRFYDKRRVIKFVNSTTTIELYSAKELLELYQKPINPSTIMDNTPKKDIAFVLYGGKVQVVTLQK